MWRYIRLYGYMVRFSFSRAMEFRVDFFFRFIMDAIFYTVNTIFFKVLFLHTPSLAGWTESQVMVFMTGFFVCDAIMMTVFSNNLWWISYLVNHGDLDHYLLRPVSSLFFLSVREFAASSALNVVLAVSLCAWAITSYEIPFSPIKIALYAVLIVNGTFLLYIVQMLAVIPVFWTHSSGGFQMIGWEVAGLSRRPDRIFRGFVRKVMLTVIPMALVVSLPTRLLFEEFSWLTLAHIFGVTAVMFGVLLFFWSFALRNYSSASS
jgi:ABC-2 type transport system permease protein